MRVFTLAVCCFCFSVNSAIAQEFTGKVYRPSEYGSARHYHPDWNWTEEETKLYNALISRRTQPCFDEYTRGMIISGGAWAKKENEPSQWSMDWRNISEPEGLSEKGKAVFWSLVRKQIAKHWTDNQYFSAETAREQNAAEKDLAGLVTENVLNVVNSELPPEPVLPSGEKILITHQAVLKWLEDKPKMVPGVYENIPMAVPLNRGKPPAGKIPRTYRD